MSPAAWFQQLVAQLGYQPKVHNQGIKFAFGTKSTSHGHYLTTTITIISILASFKGNLLDYFTIDEQDLNLSGVILKLSYENVPWAT